ncbi:MAG TPA: helix-turn-helix domain-containing protein [Ktedonosporobacter sp.]|jgi:transcriptional regulator with XRE-family HTH domain|nr:helix-turn-helix domain-containing protein [Ktedonosporobacter sp.]
MNLNDYRIELGWSRRKLAREAEIDERTLREALSGKPIYAATAGKIAIAISRGLGTKITYKDIEGLNLVD